MRVFLDTTVLVSAFAARGLCADLLDLVLLDHDLIIGHNVPRELDRALREKVKLPANRSAEITDFIAGEASQIIDRAEPVDATVDADDALVLGEARRGNAELLVTGDAALLKVGAVGGFRIVSPRQFWEVLQALAP